MKAMPIDPRRVTRIAWLAVGLLLLACAFDGWHWWQLQQINAQIQAQISAQAQSATPAPADEATERPELRFARAFQQAASAAAGGSNEPRVTDAPLNQFRALQGPTPLGQAARYNSANLLLRQAIAVRATAQPGQAIALLELAKESYRELLRQDPANWNARYNLERAQRLLPDPPETEEEAAAQPRERERAATTMRAQTLGLP